MCEEYRRLCAAYNQAVCDHGLSVGDLARAANTDITAARTCENARIASEHARQDLDAHVASHGCVEPVRYTSRARVNTDW